MDHIHSNTIEDVRIPGRHLSLEERGMIQALHRQGLSLRNIAAAVGCAHTTDFYELRRGTPKRKSRHGCAPQYMAKRGQAERFSQIFKTITGPEFENLLQFERLVPRCTLHIRTARGSGFRTNATMAC